MIKKNNSLIMSLIEQIFSIIEPFGINVDLSDKIQVFNMIKYFDDSYRDGKTLISDEAWDFLVSYYDKVFKNDYEEEVAIEGITPFPMGSPKKKAYTQHDLDLFASKYNGPYLISDKMDGVSLMTDHTLNQIRLFSKGGGKDGEVLNGADNLPQINFNVPDGQAIRGELVLPKENFQFTTNRKTNRDVASAFVRTQNKEDRHIQEGKLLDFYAYKLYSRDGNYKDTNILEMYNIINQLGFKIPTYIIVDNLIEDQLKPYFLQRKIDSPYEMDGLFITPMSISMADFEQKKIDNVIAFKVKQQGTLVKVTGVKWNPSGNKLLKPVLEYEPFKLLTGVDANGNETFYTMKGASAFNAKTYFNEGLGIDALVWVARNGDAAPQFVKVEQRSENFIYPSQPFHWSESNVDLVADNESPESISKNIDRMAKFLNVKGVGPKIAEVFVIKYKINSVHDFIINFVMSNLNDKIVNDIRQVLLENKDNIIIYMVSSALFSPKFAQVKLEEFMNSYTSLYPISNFFNIDPESLHEVIKNLSFRKQETAFNERFFEFIRIYGDPIYKFSTYGPQQFMREVQRLSNSRVSNLRTSVSTQRSSIDRLSNRVLTLDTNLRVSMRNSILKGTPYPELQTTLKNSADHRNYLLNVITGKRTMIIDDVNIPQYILDKVIVVTNDPEIVIHAGNYDISNFDNILGINIDKLL